MRASLGLKPPGWVRPKLAAVRKGCLAVACSGGCEEDPAAPPAAPPAASPVRVRVRVRVRGRVRVRVTVRVT